MATSPPPFDATQRLRWSSDKEPGFKRVREGDGFTYRDTKGRRVTQEAQLRRIRALAIPPAYTQVWICASADGHLQATGRDARGRKQYRYHPAWQQRRSEVKFESLQDFGRQLPRLRAKARRLLGGGAEPTRERVLAALVLLLDCTGMRIGNAEYARENGSFGLSTLLCRHAQVARSRMHLSFVGKSGVRHALSVDDARLARLVRRCAELPGRQLFQYEGEDGEPRRVDSGDVNAWLAEHAEPGTTAKLFRTWHASVYALELLLDTRAPTEGRALLQAVAQRLGNTPAVCRKAYIHPAVLELLDMAPARAQLRALPWANQPPAHAGLRRAERQLLALLATPAGQRQGIRAAAQAAAQAPARRRASSASRSAACNAVGA
jgi:DNA topoisomerase-1